MLNAPKALTAELTAAARYTRSRRICPDPSDMPGPERMKQPATKRPAAKQPCSQAALRAQRPYPRLFKEGFMIFDKNKSLLFWANPNPKT